MNYRQEWAEGDIEAGTLLDAIEELQNEVIKLKNDKREYVRLALQAEAEQQPINHVSIQTLERFVETVRDCYHLASSYSGSLDGVDEHGGDDHDDPVCAVFHRLYYAMFDGEKALEQLRNTLTKQNKEDTNV